MRHDCAPRDCEDCAGNASVACRCHGDPGNRAAVGSRDTARSARNPSCRTPQGTVGPRVDSPGTSAAPTCSSLLLDPAPCVTPHGRPSTRSSPEEFGQSA